MLWRGLTLARGDPTGSGLKTHRAYVPFNERLRSKVIEKRRLRTICWALAAGLSYLCGLHSMGHLKSVWLPIKTATILAH